VRRSFPSSPPEASSEYEAALRGPAHRWRDPGVIAVSGADRISFLQGQLTQEVRDLRPGESRPAAGLTPKGKLIYFGRALARPEEILLLIDASARGAVLAHLSKYAVFQKVAVRDASGEFLRLALYGTGPLLPEPPSGLVRLPPEDEFAGELVGPASSREPLERSLGALGSVAIGTEAAEVRRVEAGRPRLGQDADESNLPDEVGLQKAIAPDKGCYVGQEVVARLRTYGRVNRRLVGFRFPNRTVARGAVFPDPKKAGHELARVTSSVCSPRFGPIGLGLAFRDVAEGATLASPDDHDAVAVVHAIPFA